MNIPVIVRMGTAAAATANNKILKLGEWGFTTDTFVLKMGRGLAWNDTPGILDTITATLAGKLDKAGGTITGSLQVNGTLTDAGGNPIGGSTYTDAQAVTANAAYHPTPFSALTIAATTAWATAGKYKTNRTMTLTQNTTLSVLDAQNGAEGYCLVTQDATGGRVITYPANSLNTPTINTSPNGRTALGWKYDGTNFTWFSNKNL